MIDVKENLCPTNKVDQVIFLDWDDTLYPCSWLQSLQETPSPRTLCPVFDEVEQSILKVVKTAKSLGKTYIITSSSSKWVEQCVSTFMPGLLNDLPAVICAHDHRDRVEEATMNFTERMTFRKHQAMRSVLDPKCISGSFISIGDSPIEMHALKALPGICKSITLKSHPSKCDILEQLHNLLTTLPLIVNYHGSIDLEISTGSITSQFAAINKLF